MYVLLIQFCPLKSHFLEEEQPIHLKNGINDKHSTAILSLDHVKIIQVFFFFLKFVNMKTSNEKALFFNLICSIFYACCFNQMK